MLSKVPPMGDPSVAPTPAALAALIAWIYKNVDEKDSAMRVSK